MTNKQKELMNQLTNTLTALSLECEKDQNFTFVLASQDIFSRSLDEITSDIYHNSSEF